MADNIDNNDNDENCINEDELHRVIEIDKDTLKTLIIEWLSLDDQIKAYNEVVKDKKEEKKQYESQILELMNALQQNTILTDKGNIERNVKESKGSITPELIKATLTDILKCSQTADTYTNHIMEKRISKENISLKRVMVDKKKVIPKTAKAKNYNKKNNKENENDDYDL